MKYILCVFTIFICLSLGAQEWEELAPPPFYKHHSNGFEFDGKAIIIEGTLIEGASKEVWEYDPAADDWTQLADFPGPGRGFAIGDDWNGKYYYGFGTGAGGRLNDLWEYDPVTEEFTELPECPCPGRAHPAFIAEHDKIFMGTGSSNNGDVDDWWVYDMITMEWTQKADMPGGNRHHPFQFVDENFVYVGGGHRQNWMKWDIVNEAWITIDGEPDGRVAGSQFSYKGKGYLVGGDDRFHDHIPTDETFMEYDPLTDSWTKLASLPNGSRWANSSVVVDDILYFFGGMTFIDNVEISDFSMWKFDLSALDNPSSIDDIESSTVSVTPNPFVDVIKIKQKLSAPVSIQIYNNQGVVILERNNVLDESFDLSFLQSGAYFLKVTSDQKTESVRKIIKQ